MNSDGEIVCDQENISAKVFDSMSISCFWQSKIPEHGSVDVHSTLT